MKIKLNYISIFLSLVGLFFSYLLIMEYYGLKSELGSALCSSDDIDSCQRVAESDFSAIRSVPFFGDLPIALFGFIFYGFLTFLFFTAEKVQSNTKQILSFAFYLLCLGLFVNIILFSISVFVIETVCSLCFITYLVEFSILILTFFQIKPNFIKWNRITSLLKENFVNYTSVCILLLAAGIFIGNSSNQESNLGSHSGHNHSREEVSYNITDKIVEYDQEKNLSLDDSKAPIIGDPNAPITIIKYADYNCGHCMNTSKILDRFLETYSGMIRVLPKNFPLDGNCNNLVSGKRPGATSCVAASAAICAQQQNKFDVMYKSLYSNLERGIQHTPNAVLSIAKKYNFDINQFNRCMSSNFVTQRITEEVREAGRVGVQSTPTLFVNDKRIDSGTPNEQFLHTLIKHLMDSI